MRIDIETVTLSALTGTLGALAALMFAAPALADPMIPIPPPPPPPAQDATIQAAAGDPAPLPDGVPHLSSPENPPPDTSMTPVEPNQPRSLGYLRDLWHAVQTQEVTGKDALLLLTQRPLDPNAVPPPGMPANPTPPLPPDAPVLPPGLPPAP